MQMFGMQKKNSVSVFWKKSNGKSVFLEKKSSLFRYFVASYAPLHGVNPN